MPGASLQLRKIRIPASTTLSTKGQGISLIQWQESLPTLSVLDADCLRIRLLSNTCQNPFPIQDIQEISQAVEVYSWGHAHSHRATLLLKPTKCLKSCNYIILLQIQEHSIKRNSVKSWALEGFAQFFKTNVQNIFQSNVVACTYLLFLEDLQYRGFPIVLHLSPQLWGSRHKNSLDFCPLLLLYSCIHLFSHPGS